MSLFKILGIGMLCIFLLLFTDKKIVYADQLSDNEDDLLLDKFSEDEDSNFGSQLPLPVKSNILNLSNMIPVEISNSSIFSNFKSNSNPVGQVPEYLSNDIQVTLSYGTYQEQSKLLDRLGNECKKNKREGAGLALILMEENGFFENPFDNEEILVLASLELIQRCKWIEKKDFIKKIFANEYPYQNYRKATIKQIKIKSLSVLEDFYELFEKNEKDLYAKLLERYFSYEEYHDNDWQIKLNILTATQKFTPSNFNKILKKEYSKEEHIDLKNAMIETIGKYQDIEDLNFFDQIVKESEGLRSERWVAVVVLTNYAPDLTAQRMLEEYTAMNELEIAARAFYALSFFNIDINFFLEAVKRDNEMVRLQAVKALHKYPLDQIKDVLKYKSSKDTSNQVRKEAEKILKEKKELLEKQTESIISETNLIEKQTESMDLKKEKE